MVKLEAIKMKYGNEEKYVETPAEGFIGLIQGRSVVETKPEETVILQALADPIDSRQLRDIVKPGETVCIIISDTTRVWQKMNIFLPYIVEELNEAGVNDQDITFLCATGSHRSQTREELQSLLGEKLAGRFQVVEHNCMDKESMVRLGVTSFGTPVIVNKTAVASSHVILTGAIVFHDLAGWGGGKKSILPGISSYESIMANHALSLNSKNGAGTNPLVRCGNALNNPVHMDMLEAAAFVKPSFLFNVIIDEDGNIGKAVAGNYIKAHEAGCALVDEADSACIEAKADMVLVSAGGFPKDINLYQASKALINAKEAVKEGGVIILMAECIEGYGDNEVQLMLQGFTDNVSRERALRETYSVAKYTGYLIAEIAESFKVILVSSLDPKLLENANIEGASNISEAMATARRKIGADGTVYFMPNGSSTLPRLLKNR